MSKLRTCKVAIELSCVVDMTDRDTIRESVYEAVQDALDAEELEYIVDSEDEEEDEC